MTDDQGDAMTKNNLDHASRWKLYLDDLSAKRAAIREDDLVGYRGLGPDKTNVWSWKTVRGLVAEHNAMPVLIEIARAAKAPRHSSTKTDTTGILHLLKAWSLAAFNGGRLDTYTSSFQEWWARHQDSAERMLARVLDPVAPPPPTDPENRTSTIASEAMLRNGIALAMERSLSRAAAARRPMKIGDEICWCPYGAGGKPPARYVRGIPVEERLPSFIIGVIETLGDTKGGPRPRTIRDSDGNVWGIARGEVFVRPDSEDREASATNAAAAADGPPATRPEHNDGHAAQREGTADMSARHRHEKRRRRELEFLAESAATNLATNLAIAACMCHGFWSGWYERGIADIIHTAWFPGCGSPRTVPVPQ